MTSKKYLGKIEFIHKKGAKFDAFSDEDILGFVSMNGKGIYIFLSPGKETAYVGKSVNIMERLKTHIRGAFIPESCVETTSYKVLQEEDCEMYCCFTEDRYNYNSVNDIEKELLTLENLTIDALINSGYELVNVNRLDYDIDEIQSESFNDYRENLPLKNNRFRFGLKDILKDKMMYCRHGYKGEFNALKDKVESAIHKLQEIEKENERLKKEKQDLEKDIQEYVSKINKLEKNIEDTKDKEENLSKKINEKNLELKALKEYYDDKDLQYKKYLELTNNNNIKCSKEYFKSCLGNIGGAGFEILKDEKNLNRSSFREFRDALLRNKNFMKFLLVKADIENELENIDYSKIFTEYNFLDYLQRRTFFYVLSLYKYINCSSEDETKKDSIVDDAGEFLYKESLKLFYTLTRVTYNEK